MAEPEQGEVIPKDERIGTILMSVLLLAVGVLWIVASSQLESRVQDRYLTLAFLPMVAGILLTSIAALLILKYWRMGSRPAHELGKPPLFADRATRIRTVIVLGVLLLYILLLPHIHYAVSTFFVVLAALALAGEPIRPRLFVLATVMSAVFFVVFVTLLDVALPGSRFG